MKQIHRLTLTQAAPAAAAAVRVTDGQHASVQDCGLVASNDNASAAVEVQLVVSRSPTPLAAGDVITAKSIQRGDAVVYLGSMAAARRLLVADVMEGNSYIDRSQLFATDGCYVGARATGLESGKTAIVDVIVDTQERAITVASNTTVLQQTVTFQSV